MSGAPLSTAFDLDVELSCDVLEMVLQSHSTTPDHIAVVSGTERVSYRHLMLMASHNAASLEEAGLQAGECLLCGVDAGVELPVVWLSAMMVNAVLIPIDLSWPANRMTAVLASTRARFVYVPRGEAPRPELCGLTCLEVSTDCEGATLPPRTSCSSANTNLYGFFTSGTTGTPKCALNHHGGVANRFRYMSRYFGDGHVVYQNSAPLFDSSIWQLLWPLTSGGTTIIPYRRELWDLDCVVEHIRRHQVTMTDFVPSLFKILVRALEQGAICPSHLQSLQYVLIGGEAIDPVSVHSFRRILPGVHIINTYGHTEASIGMVFHQVRDTDAGAIPLGRPIDNTYVRIVGPQLEVLPDGIVGEVVVGGICVGNGYLNEPELTEKSFVPNLFPDVPGAFVYRTGDRARVREDGLLEFHGRHDHQVKVRGVRIELDEVNARFREAFVQVRDAAAVVVNAAQGDAALALAYTAARAIDVCELRKELGRLMPLTHIPQYFLHLQTLPVSPNGKLDYTAIAAAFIGSWQFFQAPTPAASAQDQLLECFRQVLLSDCFCQDSNFFEWGGDSLAAVSLKVLIGARFNRTLALQTLYRHPTPLSLGAALFDGNAGTKAIEMAPLYSHTLRPWGQSQRRIQEILLTGATGFVGIHILERLMTSTTLRVTVLLRGDTLESAQARLMSIYANAFTGRVLDTTRLKAVLGDLRSPCIGLDPQEWMQLTESVDKVIHCAAEVNFLSEPSHLYAANVQGTAELIRFCNESTFKRLHHVSSLAARCSLDGQVGATGAELDEHARSNGINGYGYTKYLADRLILDAQAQGMRAKIYRIDDVLPSVSMGYSHKKSLVHLLLKLCLRLGQVPAGYGYIGLLPADRLANWICHFVAAPEAFDLLAQQVDVTAIEFVTFEALVAHCANRLGMSVSVVDHRDFVAQISERADCESMLIAGILAADTSKRVLFTDPSDVNLRESSRQRLGLTQYQELMVTLSEFEPFVERLAGELV